MNKYRTHGIFLIIVIVMLWVMLLVTVAMDSTKKGNNAEGYPVVLYERELKVFDTRTGFVTYDICGVFEAHIEENTLKVEYAYNNLCIEEEIFLGENVSYVIQYYPGDF